MRRLGIAPKLKDIKQEFSTVVDSWFDSITERLNIQSKSGAPTVAEVPENQWGMFKDTSGGDVALYVNDSGTLKHIELTTSGGGGSSTLTTSTASGTSVNFTNLGSGLTEITVSWANLSTNGTSNIAVRFGTGGVAATSGYVNSIWSLAGAAGATYTGGFLITQATGATSDWSGAITFTLIDASTNTWAAKGLNTPQSTNIHISTGHVVMSGEVDMVSVTTLSGTQVFDNGTIGVLCKS